MSLDASFDPVDEPEHSAEIVTLRTGVRRFADSEVRRVASWLEASPILEQVVVWKAGARRGAGGRPESFPLKALLVAMLLAAISNQPMQLSTFSEVMYLQLSPTMRAELGIPEPTTPWPAGSMGTKDVEHQTLYRNVRTRFHGLLALMDPSPWPKNRRMDKDRFAAVVAERQAVLCHEELALRYDRLSWFVNQLIEASIALLPREIRRKWRGSVAVDATAVRAYAQPSRPAHSERTWVKSDPMEVYSADPDAGRYVRTGSGARQPKGAGASKTKSVWAYEATLAVAGPDEPGKGSLFPNLVMAMPPLHRPGHEPGLNAIRALRSIRERGYPSGWVAGDRAYTDAKAEHFALPARALGYRPVLDYAQDHLGIQGTEQGFAFIEGAWFCPALPEGLINATIDFNNNIIDDATYRSRLAERARYAALAKARPDGEGFQRWRCPAAGPHPVVACPLKPASQRHDGRVRVAIRPSGTLRANPPRCCAQASVTIGPEPMAKFRQDLTFQSPEWSARYHSSRSTIEGMTGFLKDGAREALDDPQRRRVRGVAAQSLFVALLVFAGNVRKIEAFLKRGAPPASKAPRRRRQGQPISAWSPAGPPAPDDPRSSHRT
jgi:hypothetical protein